MEYVVRILTASSFGIRLGSLLPGAGFLRKCLILMTILLFSNPVSLFILGLLNRLFFNPIQSIFICYPATPKYTEKYCFKFLLPYIKHYPVIVGGFFQGGRIGIICTISALESDFHSSHFFPNFTRWSNLMRDLLGVQSVSYSGILPSAMKKALFLSEEELKVRCTLVGNVVVGSEKLVREKLNISASIPIILLGGKGSVGQEAAKLFLEQGRDVYVVDKGDQLPSHLINQEAILIDVARKDVLKAYLSSLWKGLVIINETYPEPPKEVVNLLKKKEIPLFHIAGVKARAFPSFPHAYAGGVPCCAMNPAKNVKPLVKVLE